MQAHFGEAKWRHVQLKMTCGRVDDVVAEQVGFQFFAVGREGEIALALTHAGIYLANQLYLDILQHLLVEDLSGDSAIS